ncbi:MAG TPA: HAD-IIB family hydrolase [Lactobacillaceae bacterium]|jgi:hypothetical protein
MGARLIVTDLDETFLRSNRTFDEALFRQVLSEIDAAGAQFAIATGRHLSNVEQVFADILKERGIHIVSNNGAHVQAANGDVLFERSLPVELLPEIDATFQAFSYKPAYGYLLTTTRNAYMPRTLKNIIMRFTPRFRTFFDRSTTFRQISDVKEPILKVTAAFPKTVQPVFVKFAKERLGDRVHITETGTGAIDIVPAGINKAVGVQQLMTYLNIDVADVAAFGDGGNDLEMLGFVGQPYRMPNASQNVAAHTEFNVAVADNNHNGVLRTIQEKLL